MPSICPPRAAPESYHCETAQSFGVNNEEIGTVVLWACHAMHAHSDNPYHGPVAVAAAEATVIMLLPFTIALRDFLSEANSASSSPSSLPPLTPFGASLQLSTFSWCVRKR